MVKRIRDGDEVLEGDNGERKVIFLMKKKKHNIMCQHSPANQPWMNETEEPS